MRSLLAGIFVFSLLFAMSPEAAHAYAGTNPNIIRRMNQRNFRLPVGDAEKYRQSRRARERRGIDAFTTPAGEASSFDRRAEYLRETQLRRIQEDVDSRAYTDQSRANARAKSREDRSRDSSVRRIRRAERGGGLRLRGTSTRTSTTRLSADERRALAAQNRARVIEAQMKRYSEVGNIRCNVLSGRRQANCLYKLRNR